ncbi:MAG TPA: cytochrome C oxidase subunit IV family protein [Tepidisphaeraceae bacterium]|nr:cytochrome C oxidase subunit IV family protein [Tepidisphaeraceae bacterium]HUB24385.1 cytochrome C oxidase subunit IV family protein [Tepidisphaeraceae bacterium]
MVRKVHPIGLYLIVYVVLLLLLVLTVWISFFDLGRYANNSIAMGIGCVKAFLIVLIFMHMKYERWITWYFPAAGVVWLCIMIGLTMTDYLTRNHPPQSSPKGEPVLLSER